MVADHHTLPLIYACSGCSNAAQLANALAVRADREGWAEMSCISGVGGDVAPLVKLARSSRPIVALDGCLLQCTVACLQRAGVTPTRSLILSDLGIRKRHGCDYTQEELSTLAPDVRSLCEESTG